MDYHAVFANGLLRFDQDDYPVAFKVTGEINVQTDTENGVLTIMFPIEVKGQEPGRMIYQIAGQVNISDFTRLITNQTPPQI